MKRNTWFALLMCELAVIGYNLTFFNRYLPITEGWFSLYAQAIRNGQVPYRDFHLILPPLYPAILAVFTSIFGDSFLALRILGVVLMGGFSGLLFYIFRFRFSVGVSAFISFLATVYYQSGTAHIGYDFLQWMSVFSLGALALIISAANEWGDRKKGDRFDGRLFGAGLLLSCAGLVKQSNSAWITLWVCAGLIVALFGSFEPKRVFRSVLFFFLGLFLPLLATFAYLQYTHAFQPFLEQVIVDASSAKGNILSIFWAWIPRHLNSIEMSKACLGLGILFIFGVSFKTLYRTPDRVTFRKFNLSMTFSPIILLSLSILFFISVPSLGKMILGIKAFPIVEIYYSIVVSSFVFCCLGFIFSKDSIFKLLFISALGFIFGNGTSGGVSEAGAFFGYSILAGILLDGPIKSRLFKITVYFFLCLICLFSISNKWTNLYSWWGVEEGAVTSQNMQSTVRCTKGFYLSSKKVDLFEKIDQLLRQHSIKGDEVLCLPALPIFNIISQRTPERKILIHWFDVIPDSVAIGESIRIFKNPPKIIVFLRQNNFVMEGHEMLFRNSREIGQRVLFEAVEKMIHNKVYREVANFNVPEKNSLLILVRN